MSIWICSLGKSLIRKNNQKTDPETYFVSLVLANTFFLIYANHFPGFYIC